VASGEQLCICYSDAALFQPREVRRALLHERWGFWCRCSRCEGTLPTREKQRWALLEEAAAAADGAKPRPSVVDPSIVTLQLQAAKALDSWLPWLAEGARFKEDAAYFRGSQDMSQE